jgi:hypothetical protein
MATPPPDKLKEILPEACAWAERFERYALSSGAPLTAEQARDATAAGVLHPEKIRLELTTAIPCPQEGLLAQMNLALGLITSATAGLTLRYGIFIVKTSLSDRKLLAHEFAHVAQYERLGGIEGFLERYLSQCAAHGYENAPMESEAIAVSQRVCR